MLILPLKFIREEDKKIVGINLFNLAKLSHLGLPVIESVVAVPPVETLEKAVIKFLKHGNIKDNLNNIKTEILNLPVPESLASFDLVRFSQGPEKLTVNIPKLWKNLLEKWSYEIMSRIERGEKKLFELTPQLVVFSANFSVFGQGYFDEDKSHAVLKTDKGQLNFNLSSEIEDLILLGNRKLLIPQVYYFGIESGKVKIIKVMPFTQSLPEEHEEKIDKFIPVHQQESPSPVKTATKIYLDYQGEVLTDLNADGVVLKLDRLNTELVNENIDKVLKFNSQTKIIFYPNFELTSDATSDFAKLFLFFRNKKKLDIQIVLPQTFTKEEFLNLKREFAALGIYSKGSLKIWKQFKTVQDFLQLDDYLEAGFDGAIIDLDSIAKIVTGVDADKISSEPTLDWLNATENFLRLAGFNKLIKSGKNVLIIGALAKNEDLLNYFIKSGVWGVAFENNIANALKQHIGFLEKQVVKKLPRVEVEH